MKLQLLSKGYTNAKLKKSVTESYILYIAPAALNTAGINLCPGSTAGCRKACLYTAGRGAMSSVQKARLRKADWYVTDREGFLMQLSAELSYLNERARVNGRQIAVRLNGTSDIDWEVKLDLSRWQSLQFYDYTKRLNRAFSWAEGSLPTNYHLTFSASEVTQDKQVQKLLLLGINVAVVFTEQPADYLGFEVIDGDKSDERWTDLKGVVVGLTAKGQARKDESGFVRTINNETRKAG
jgi:hypothetical protein